MSVSKEFRLFSHLYPVATGNSLNAYCYNGERERENECGCVRVLYNCLYKIPAYETCVWRLY